MGRRSQHTPDQLRELILEAARKIVVEKGFREASAREIAREIGYAPGTLYNMYRNLDEIMLLVECRVLDELDEQLAKATAGSKGVDALRRFAASYAEFAYSNPQLWDLVREHHPATRAGSPDWYLAKLNGPRKRLENLIAEVMPADEQGSISRTAHLVWASIHGILSVTLTPKYGVVSLPSAKSMAETAIVQQLVSAPDRRNSVHRRDGGGAHLKEAG